MRRWIIIGLALGCLAVLYATVMSAVRVFSFDMNQPMPAEAEELGYRLVLISQELDTPFWKKVEQGAKEAARQYGASLELWGTYSTNTDDFLKKIEIAISSKVDGIIVQGLDSDEFKELTKIKAAGSGIPVITVANDVPMNESLRRTYVGSDHWKAGQLIARQLVDDMGEAGKVVIMLSDRQEHFQRSRLTGILDMLSAYPDIRTQIVASGDKREKVAEATNQVLNKVPDADAFIAVTANNADAIIQEIGKRFRTDNYLFYTFDDSPETQTLMQEGKIKALLQQSPEMMGEISVGKMIGWLRGDILPLDPDGYYTDIRVVRGERGR
ncbi:sugar ABC transporter substrate-binding protein [Paenibacillus tarimensis]